VLALLPGREIARLAMASRQGRTVLRIHRGPDVTRPATPRQRLTVLPLIQIRARDNLTRLATPPRQRLTVLTLLQVTLGCDLTRLGTPPRQNPTVLTRLRVALQCGLTRLGTPGRTGLTRQRLTVLALVGTLLRTNGRHRPGRERAGGEAVRSGSTRPAAGARGGGGPSRNVTRARDDPRRAVGHGAGAPRNGRRADALRSRHDGRHDPRRRAHRPRRPGAEATLVDVALARSALVGVALTRPVLARPALARSTLNRSTLNRSALTRPTLARPTLNWPALNRNALARNALARPTRAWHAALPS
jgi:hypothetical protein